MCSNYFKSSFVHALMFQEPTEVHALHVIVLCVCVCVCTYIIEVYCA